MKKLFLLSLSCALAASATAQTEKGARYIGANVGNLSYNRNDDDSFFSARLSPGAGVFVADNFLLGAELQLGYALQKTETSNQTYRGRSLDVGLSPFARYYLPGTGAHRFFGQLQGGVVRNSNRIESRGTTFGSGGQVITFNQDQRSRNTSTSFGASLGYNYFLTPSAAFQAIASYNRFGYGNSNNAGNFGVSAGFAVFLPSKGAAAQTD